VVPADKRTARVLLNQEHRAFLLLVAYLRKKLVDVFVLDRQAQGILGLLLCNDCIEIHKNE
jgi:hypothetical protein